MLERDPYLTYLHFEPSRPFEDRRMGRLLLLDLQVRLQVCSGVDFSLHWAYLDRFARLRNIVRFDQGSLGALL